MKPNPSDLVAEISGVSHHYRKTLALDDIHAEIPQGAVTGLIGPDGVGKSTMLGLIAGARKIETGTVDVLGGSMADAGHRRKACLDIAYMPQGLGKNLYAELSVFENLDFFGRLFGLDHTGRQARIAMLLRATGLDPFPDRLAGKLSGGMKQKLGLCCALINDPKFLILDEPTTGVDPLSRRQFWELIAAMRAAHAGMSVFVSTAYMEEAEDFDWLLAMNAGKILASGTPAALKKQTRRKTLEDAFVALLPKDERSGARKLSIPPRPKDHGEPVIVAEGLTRRFGDFTAVDDVSFSIERGEIFGFLGSNGCGKTTTMKMLTGLLPASDGQAWIFGNPAKAHDIETRRRVGYMSQSFSLYSELTVSQNLKLHARLFHLPADRAKTRIADLVERFGLENHVDDLAGDLPLGLRQRLSLAVAIIHEPEMLILDEPTSGVDPLARDRFWQLLVDLSRKERVTIFISTHFMNEAMRCDRISLMHAGRVLACDTPKKLVKAKRAANLEQAFIVYMEEAEGIDSDAAPAAQSAVIEQSDAAEANARRARRPAWLPIDPGRLLAYSYRETLEVIRDPVRLVFAFLGSAILLLIFGFGISMDTEDLRFTALDLDQSPASRAYLSEYTGSRYFIEQPQVTSQAELAAAMQAHKVDLGIEIPPNFGRQIKRGETPSVRVSIDGANPFRAETIEGYVNGLHESYLQKLARQEGRSEGGRPPAVVEARFRYNPSFESIYAMAPRMPPLLLILIPAILMAVSVVREKELGSITNFYVTPTKKLEFLLGKQLPYVAIAMLNFAMLTVMVLAIFGVPLKGSLFALVMGALFYVWATTGIGLLVSAFTRSQVAAVFATTIIAMMPTIQFSGLLQPVSTLEGGARIMGLLWPTTYYMQVSVGAFTKALSAKDLWIDVVALAAFIPVLTGLAAFSLAKQER